MKHISYSALSILVAVAMLVLNGCSDDDRGVDATPSDSAEFGSQTSVELPADLSHIIPQGQLAVNLLYMDGKARTTVRGTHSVSEAGKSVIGFERRIRVGSYVIASVYFKEAEGRVKEVNMGCTMNVDRASNSVLPHTYDVDAGFFGNGTADEPYRIGSQAGLDLMRYMFADGAHDSDGIYFRQVSDIDMTSSYNKGFQPICGSAAFPFRGNYDGGGHSIYWLAVRMLDDKNAQVSDVVPASGLFGYASGASFRDLNIVDPVAIGAGSTGTLVGAVAGRGGVEETSTTLTNIHVTKKSSTSSEVFGTNFVGGIVGGVDINAVLVLTDCSNDGLPVTCREDGSFVGGLLGGGTVNASAVIQNCTNKAVVTGKGSRCAGGIIGGIEAATVADTHNYGTVSAPKCLGTGGIAGGLGTSTFAAVTNYGEVRGDTGTGGIVGSTVVSKSDGSYNDIIITSGHNYGSVEGCLNTGGIIGEAQGMLADCYNRGDVTGTEAFTGGLMGYAPVTAINSSYNAGSINGVKCAGGIMGRAMYYILGGCSNVGSVSATSDMAGGILGLGGCTGMINFCNNYGDVSAPYYAGGIAARVGDSYALVESDVASLVTSYGKSAIKIFLAVKKPPTQLPDFLVKLKKGHKILKVVTSSAKLIYDIVTPAQAQDVNRWDELYEHQLPERNDAMVSQMLSEVSAMIPAYTGQFPGISGLPMAVYDNNRVFVDTLTGDNDDIFSQNVHDRLADISDQVAEVEEAKEIALAVASCVLAVAGLVVSGPASVATIVLSAAVTTAGILTTRMDNAVEVSQCCNFGAVNAGADGYGIVARLGDHVRLSDCFSAGQTSGRGIAEKNGQADVHAKRTLAVGVCDQYSFGSGGSEASGHFYWANVGAGGSPSGARNASDLALKDTYTSVPDAFDFDNNAAWAFLVPAVPVPYNNLYLPFR